MNFASEIEKIAAMVLVNMDRGGSSFGILISLETLINLLMFIG